MRKPWLVCMSVAAIGLAVTPAHADSEANESDPCKIIEHNDGLSSSVTIGNGNATASTTIRGSSGSSGSSVTVHSGGGGASSSVATSTANGTSVVTSSGGDCVVTHGSKGNSKGN